MLFPAIALANISRADIAFFEEHRLGGMYPLYAYIRRRGHIPEEAQDLTQGFFLHLLEHKTLGRADPLKGKFRSFCRPSACSGMTNL
jgi:hypothetical protein